MPDAPPVPAPNRRTVVIAGAAVLGGAGVLAAGCSTAQNPTGAPTATTPEVGSATSAAAPTSEAGSSTEAAPAAGGTALGATSEVPVGSARIYDAEAVVVTQATAGEFAAFSAVCPHQGCNVSAVEGADIVCRCHNSVFALDGSRVSGPAPSGLESRTVSVDGDQLTLT